jgi:hypothetical protein
MHITFKRVAAGARPLPGPDRVASGAAGTGRRPFSHGHSGESRASGPDYGRERKRAASGKPEKPYCRNQAPYPFPAGGDVARPGWSRQTARRHAKLRPLRGAAAI